MAIAYTIEPEANLIRVSYEGSFTIAEMITHSLRVNDDPLFVKGMNTLSDLREARLVDDVSAIRDYVEHAIDLKAVRGACRWACLVADEAGRDMIWSFDLVLRDRGGEIETKGFLDESEALAWLAKRP